jgi:protein-L-isoaspartate(D-aspartate) O-methyltransferase
MNRTPVPGPAEIERRRMVEEQIISRGITGRNVIAALLKVPRELFVSKENAGNAYSDHPVPIGSEQTISQPYMVALMTDLLLLKGDEKVLEIGTGSGYQTAILAELSGKVYTVERLETLQEKAKKILSFMGYKNIYFKAGDGTLGWKEFAPFDRIMVTAGVQDVPPPFTEQLAEGGKMVIPVGSRTSQVLTLLEKENGEISMKNITGCIFVPLVGKYGW